MSVEYSENTMYGRVLIDLIITAAITGVIYAILLSNISLPGTTQTIDYGIVVVDIYGCILNGVISLALIVFSLLILRKIWFLISRYYIFLHAMTFVLNFIIYLGASWSIGRGLDYPAIGMIGATLSLMIFMSTYGGLKTVGEIGDRGRLYFMAFILPTWSSTAYSSMLAEAVLGIRSLSIIGRGGMMGVAFLGSISATAMVTTLLLAHYMWGSKETSIHIP